MQGNLIEVVRASITLQPHTHPPQTHTKYGSRVKRIKLKKESKGKKQPRAITQYYGGPLARARDKAVVNKPTLSKTNKKESKEKKKKKNNLGKKTKKCRGT